MKKITIFLIGVFMLASAGKVMALTPPCTSLWWFDSSNNFCSQKSFCGSYMYQDLRTYKTLAECRSALGVKDQMTVEASCGGVTMTGNRTVTINNSIRSTNSVWQIVEDTKTKQKVLINWYYGYALGSSKITEENFYFGNLRRGGEYVDKLPIVSDGRIYTVKAYTAPFTEGLPVFKPENLLVSTNFSLNCPTSPTPGVECKNLWWIDNTNKECSQKEFCGAYMYLGLQTFTTEAECKMNILPTVCALKKCGDANCDGSINSLDLIIWRKESTELKGNSADFNSDNKTDKLDYDLLVLGLQKKCPTDPQDPGLELAKEGQYCGASPNGVVKCEPGLRCDESRYEVDDKATSISKMKTGAGGICVKVTPTSKPLPIDTCRLKVCGDANCDGKIDSKDRLAWIRERFSSSRTADFNKDNKIDSKDYSIMTSGIQNKCQPTIISRVTTPFPTKKIITQAPTYTCSVLYEKNINSEPNNFKNCLSGGFPKICFDKYTGVYQGCGTSERDTCTEFNTNAARNIQCDSNMATITSVPTTSPLAPLCCQSTIKPNSGKAPLTVILHGCGYAENGPGFDGYRWDFDGNGSWDTRGVLIDAVTYSYTSAGVYRPKFQIHGVNNVWSEVCDYGYDVVVTGKIPTKVPTLVPCKEGPSNFSVDTSCGTNLFRYATYTCFDGLQGKLGSDTSCKTAVEFSAEARNVCVNHGSSCETLTPTFKPKEPTVTPTRKPTSVRPTGNLGCDRKGDGDGDGVVTLKDYAAWRYEYSISKAIKSDFNCDRKIDKNDYEIWKKAFLSKKELTVTTEN